MAAYTNFLVGGTTGHPSKMRTPYLVESVVDFSVQNGEANDTFGCIQVPAETVCLGVWSEVLTVDTGLTTGTYDIGITGGDVDEWVDGAVTTSTGLKASVGDGTAGPVHVLFDTADTIDLLVLGTGTATAGIIRVAAMLLDVSGIRETATGDQG